MPSKLPTLRVELFVPGLGPGPTFDHLVSELEVSLSQVGIRFDGGPAGRLAEDHLSSEQPEIARVTAWEPGKRIALSWSPVDPKPGAPSISVSYRFDPLEDGTRITLEYGDWDPATPLGEGAERVGWFASAILPPIIRSTSPGGFGDWWTDRVARRPSGPAARATYGDPVYHRPNFLVLLERLHLSESDRLLEVGCGGGAFLHDALESGCRAFAIDHSPDMVRLAREKNRDAIDQHRADIVEGDAHRLPFPDASCTCAVTTGSFGFWDRPVVALTEIHRVLRPGGRFLMFVGTKELRGTPAASEPMASRIHWYESEELVALAREAGFSQVQVDRPSLGKYARLVGVPAEALPLFDAEPGNGQFLEARKPDD